MLTTIPYVNRSDLKKYNMEFDSLELFTFLSSDASVARIFLFINLWKTPQPASTGEFVAYLPLPAQAQNVRGLDEKASVQPNRTCLPASFSMQQNVAVFQSDITQVTPESNLWLGMRYEIPLKDRTFDLSLFSPEQVRQAGEYLDKKLSYIPFRSADMWLIFDNSKLEAVGTLNASEGLVSGDQLSDCFKTYRGINKSKEYMRYLWRAEYPAPNKPFYLNVFVSSAAIDWAESKDIKSVVVNMSRHVKALDDRLLQMEGRVLQLEQSSRR